MKSSTKYLSAVGLVISLVACGTPQAMPDREMPDGAADSQQVIQEDSSGASDAVSEEISTSEEDSSIESDASDSSTDASDSSVDSSADSSLPREPNVIYRSGPSTIQLETSDSATVNAFYIRRRDYGGPDAGCQYIARTSIGACDVLVRVSDTSFQFGDGGFGTGRISFAAEYGRCFDRTVVSPVLRLEIPSSDIACPGSPSVTYNAPTNVSVRWE